MEYGQKHSNLRSILMGYECVGYGHFIAGDLSAAIEFSQKAVQVSVDPLYSCAGKLLLGFSYAFCGRFQEIEEIVGPTWRFCRDVGCLVWGTMAEMLLGITCVANGQMSKGLRMVGAVRDSYEKKGRKGQLALPEYLLGKIYLQVVEGTHLPSLSTLARNLGFMVKNVPSAAKKAQEHYERALAVAEEIGARNYMARAYLDLGVLHKAKKRPAEARECVLRAIDLFRQCEAEILLEQAEGILKSLG